MPTRFGRASADSICGSVSSRSVLAACLWPGTEASTGGIINLKTSSDSGNATDRPAPFTTILPSLLSDLSKSKRPVIGLSIDFANTPSIDVRMLGGSINTD